MDIEPAIQSPATAGVVDVARHIAGAAEFIEHHYLGGLMMQTMPLHPFMSYLHHRLLNYEWLLLKNKRAFHDWEDPLPPPKDAIKTLKWLKTFFYLRASSEREILKQVNDRALGDDVGFVGDLTERLLEGKERTTEREMQGVLEVNKRQAVALRAAHDALKEPLKRPWELTEMVLKKFAEEDREATTPGGLDNVLLEGAYGDAEVEVNGACTPVDDEIPGRTTPDQEHSSREDQQPPSRQIYAHPPYHTSGRAWFANPVTFADLIGSPHQWTHPPPSTYTLISSNNTNEEGASHFIDATALGISGLTTLKIQHPLNGTAVKTLDWDVLRFLRVALWDYTNGHPERKKERESLQVLRGELRRREGDALEGPVVEPVHDQDGSRCEETATSNDVNGDTTLPAHSEELRELPPTKLFGDEDAAIQLNGATPSASLSADSSRAASNTSLDHLFESARPLSEPEPHLYTNNSTEENHPTNQTHPYENPNNHIHDNPQTTQSPTYLMSMSGAYNPITPLFLQQQESTTTGTTAHVDTEIPRLPFSVPNDTDGKKPCCFNRMKRKLHFSRRKNSEPQQSTTPPPPPPPLTPPSSPSPSASSLSSSDPWLAPLNTSYRYNPSPSPKKSKLRSSRGRGRIEARSKNVSPETGFDFDFDVDERFPVEIINGLRVGEV